MKDLEMSSWEDGQDDAPRCRACCGPLVFFGTLGGADWGRCRNCGMDGQMNHDDENCNCGDPDCGRAPKEEE